MELIKIAENGQWVLEKATRRIMPNAAVPPKEPAKPETPVTKPVPQAPPVDTSPLRYGRFNSREVSTPSEGPQHRTQSPITARTEESDQNASAIEAFLARKARSKQIAAAGRRQDPYQGMRVAQRHGPSEEDRLHLAAVRSFAEGQEEKPDRKLIERTVSMTGDERENPNAKIVAMYPGQKPDRSKFGNMPVNFVAGPVEAYTDPTTGERVQRMKQGRFNNEGATTYGDLVERRIPYKDKETGKYGVRTVEAYERHTWRWDDDNKIWRHVRTDYESPNQRWGTIHNAPEVYDPKQRGRSYISPDDDDDYY